MTFVATQDFNMQQVNSTVFNEALHSLSFWLLDHMGYVLLMCGELWLDENIPLRKLALSHMKHQKQKNDVQNHVKIMVVNQISS